MHLLSTYFFTGADLNAQFKIVHANGKSVASIPDKTNIKRTAALAKYLANSMKTSQKENDDGSSRKKSISHSINDGTGDRVGSSLGSDTTGKELQAVFDSIEPGVKTHFLKHEVR